MDKLVEAIAKALVDKPEAVEVNLRQDGNVTVIEIHADADDLGKIIGKEGKIAKAIRTVVKAASTKSGERVVVDILQ
ncbi:MAG: KH domain-containing protein [Peptoniphilaceae bacterium]|nr:KH domain-containing protein [Peptoniphilaceae bacterium]